MSLFLHMLIALLVTVSATEISQEKSMHFKSPPDFLTENIPSMCFYQVISDILAHQDY
jgi:hypothetical protein